MRVLIFGATGMIGQGVLRECLNHPEVRGVTSVVRKSDGAAHPKLHEIVHPDLLNYSSIESQLTGFDACFFCLGISSVGLSEPEYERITYGIATAAAQTLARLNPQMTFIFVSGAGADSTESGPVAWARIKGKTENAILRLPFKAAYVFRPAIVQPLDGIRSKTRAYRVGYTFTKPLLPLLRAAFPGQVLTTRSIGQAMLIAARTGAPKRILESRDIYALR